MESGPSESKSVVLLLFLCARIAMRRTTTDADRSPTNRLVTRMHTRALFFFLRFLLCLPLVSFFFSFFFPHFPTISFHPAPCTARVFLALPAATAMPPVLSFFLPLPSMCRRHEATWLGSFFFCFALPMWLCLSIDRTQCWKGEERERGR